MGFWQDTKRLMRFKIAQDRVQEGALYAQVMDELEQGSRDKGLWGKALADCEGDETKANAKYIKLRVVALADLMAVANDMQSTFKESADDKERREEAERVKREERLIELSKKAKGFRQR